MALSLAVLLNYQEFEVDFRKLMLDLCAFSYNGDIRMKWKMENPNKV